MERAEPLSIRSPNRPNPSSILKRTIQTPSTIRKTNSTTKTLSKLSSPGKHSSPTREWASRSIQSPTKTPKPRPTSMVDPTKFAPDAPSTIRPLPPNTIQRVNRMFDQNTSSPGRLQTPSRPHTNDLLISFETPTQQPPSHPPSTTRKTLLDLDLDDLFAPTPKARSSYSETSLSDLISSTLEAERTKWMHEADMRHAADLEALAADLHGQYREKHTRKVDALKVTYKKQYDKKSAGLEEKIRELEGQVEELKGELEKEGREKRELIEMSEELMRLTGQGGES